MKFRNPARCGRVTPLRGLLAGLAAGAAGTTALNTVAYLDMTLRARPTSSTPEDTASKLADAVGVGIPGGEDERKNRLAGLGALTGIAAGLGIGAVLGVGRALGFRPRLPLASVVTGAGAMAATIAPMAALEVTDPTTWAAQDWVSDVVPHFAYGAVTAWVVQAIDTR